MKERYPMLDDHFPGEWEHYIPDDGDKEYSSDWWWVKVKGQIYQASLNVSPKVPDERCMRVRIGKKYYYFS